MKKLNLNSQQLHFPPPQVPDTDIKSLRSCCREEGKKRVIGSHQGFTNWNHVFHRWKSSARWQRGGCTPVMRAHLSSNTAEPPLKHSLGQGRGLRRGQAGQRPNSREPTGSGHLWHLMIGPQFGGGGAKEQKSKQSTKQQQNFYTSSPHSCSRLWMSKNCTTCSSNNFFSAVKI